MDQPLIDALGDDTPDPGTAARLDRALAAALPPPALPADFRVQLMARMHQAAAEDLARQRAALQAEHDRQLRALRDGHIRLRRDSLATLVGVAFAAGTLFATALPWLREQVVLEGDALSVLPLLAAGVIGMAVGSGWWWEKQRRGR